MWLNTYVWTSRREMTHAPVRRFWPCDDVESCDSSFLSDTIVMPFDATKALPELTNYLDMTLEPYFPGIPRDIWGNLVARRQKQICIALTVEGSLLQEFVELSLHENYRLLTNLIPRQWLRVDSVNLFWEQMDQTMRVFVNSLRSLLPPCILFRFLCNWIDVGYNVVRF